MKQAKKKSAIPWAGAKAQYPGLVLFTRLVNQATGCYWYVKGKNPLAVTLQLACRGLSLGFKFLQQDRDSLPRPYKLAAIFPQFPFLLQFI